MVRWPGPHRSPAPPHIQFLILVFLPKTQSRTKARCATLNLQQASHNRDKAEVGLPISDIFTTAYPPGCQPTTHPAQQGRKKLENYIWELVEPVQWPMFEGSGPRPVVELVGNQCLLSIESALHGQSARPWLSLLSPSQLLACDFGQLRTYSGPEDPGLGGGTQAEVSFQSEISCLILINSKIILCIRSEFMGSNFGQVFHWSVWCRCCYNCYLRVDWNLFRWKRLLNDEQAISTKVLSCVALTAEGRLHLWGLSRLDLAFKGHWLSLLVKVMNIGTFLRYIMDPKLDTLDTLDT